MNAHNEQQWPEANYTLGAGGNPNTVDLRVMLAHDVRTPEPLFYVSRWEMSDDERRAHAENIILKLRESYAFGMGEEISNEEMIKIVSDNLPLIYVMQMHTPVPVQITTNDPTNDAYPFIDDFMQPDHELARHTNRKS